MKEISEKLNALLVRSGSKNPAVAQAATAELAKALEMPLRKGIMSGDILGNIFEVIKLAPDASPEFPVDFLAPGTEKEHVAYTIPNHGMIPFRHVEGDYVMVPTFDIGNSIDWNIKYARQARWDVVGRAMRVLESGFVKKMNDDGWHLLLSAGVDRNIVVYDSDAAQGQFTKRLISLGKTVMRRNGGGNSSSVNRGKLTDIYVSPETKEDTVNWGIDQIDEATRNKFFNMGDDTVLRIFNVTIHDIDEFGVAQEYQNFFTSTLGGSLATSGSGHGHNDVELIVGLDLTNRDSFVMPVRQEVEIQDDNLLLRQRRAGLFGTAEVGFGSLDGRRVLLASC